MIEREQLLTFLNQYLNVEQFSDYCPNGLQVEGKSEISRIILGVTASQELIDAAVAKKADALLVHHGFFWKGESAVITGMKYRRIKALIENGINLIAYHLPLDAHPQAGNNVVLAKRLGLQVVGPLDAPKGLVLGCELPTPVSVAEFAGQIERSLDRSPLLIEGGKHAVQRVGICTGAAQDEIELAAAAQMDAFISGEISERTTYLARELGIHYLGVGHHASERYGVQALGQLLAEQFALDVEYIEISNPV